MSSTNINKFSFPKRDDIQGLRALAVLLVVAYHAELPIHSGFLGVDIFFVISGFLITGLLQHEFSNTNRIEFGKFLFKRFRRLIPAVSVYVSLTALLSVLLLSPFSNLMHAAKNGFYATLGLANFYNSRSQNYFDPAAEVNPFLNAWSLSVEQQFYLLAPITIAIMLGVKSRFLVKTWILFLFIIFCASFLLALLFSTGFEIRGQWLFGNFYSPVPHAK